MTVPIIPERKKTTAEIKANVSKLVAAGAPDEDISAYLEAEGYPAQSRRDASPVPRESLRLDVRAPAESTRGAPYDPHRAGDVEALKSAPAALPAWIKEGSGPTAALALSAAQGVPGVESLEAAMGSVGSKFTDNPMGFRESRDVLRGETNKIPAEVRTALQLVAGGAASKLPGVARLSPAKAGAAFGGASQALSADDMPLEDRLVRTGIGGAAGALIGKGSDMVTAGGRAAFAKPFDKNLLARGDAMASADKAAYGAAEKAMTAAGGTSPGIKSALNDPVVVPFVKAVRSSQQFANADDATVLRETYKLMSERQRSLGGRITNSDDYRAGSSLEKTDIDAAKKTLLRAADDLGQEFRSAVAGHAKAEGEIAALKLGKTAADRTIGFANPTSMKSARSGRAALTKRLPNMSLEERMAAEEGALARLRRGIGIQPNLPSAGGLLTTAIRPMRAAPLLREIGTPKQALLDDLIRAGIISGSGQMP